MIFKIGETVVHYAHGVGQIMGIEEKAFFDSPSRQYYVISIQNGTLWVPVEAREDAGLRVLSQKGDFKSYRLSLKSQPAALEHDFRKRRSELAERLKEGTFQSMCDIVRDLTALSWHKPLSEADATLLRKIQENMCQEWAASNGISVADASKEIEIALDGSPEILQRLAGHFFLSSSSRISRSRRRLRLRTARLTK